MRVDLITHLTQIMWDSIRYYPSMSFEQPATRADCHQRKDLVETYCEGLYHAGGITRKERECIISFFESELNKENLSLLDLARNGEGYYDPKSIRAGLQKYLQESCV